MASQSSVTEGDSVAFRASIVGGGRATCTRTTSAGRLSSTSGTEVTLNTTGVRGPVTVRAMVTIDERRCDQPCPGSSCAATITVHEVPPPPRRPDVLKPCGPIFFAFNSARINNEHNACLDQIALALDQDSRARLVMDGHRDSSERAGLSLTRANNARDYLVSEKGIDPARITIRNFGDTCPHERAEAHLNRRVELWVLPQGTTIDDVDGVKRCRPGSSPRVITDKEPAPETEPSRPQKRRPEPVSDSTEPDARYSANVPALALATRERELAPATQVNSVSTSIVNGALRVKVETNGIVQFKDFTLTSPSRIVIDLPGIRSALGSRTIPVVTGLVDRVRVGEPWAGRRAHRDRCSNNAALSG